MDINLNEIESLIQRGENLMLEFKSDQKGLSDQDLVKSVVSLANTEGGTLLLGVEDDGTISGLHEKHQDTSGITPLITNQTNPPIFVHVERHDISGKLVARILVPKSQQPVSTSDGRLLRRQIKFDGTPEMVPMYPNEIIQRQSSLGLVDPSFMPVTGVSAEQLDPLQRFRLKGAIRQHSGDQPLLALEDQELDGALGLCREVDGIKYPTVTGLLLLGTEEQLRLHLPSYEVTFQVLQGTDVQVNESFRKPLLEVVEAVELLFRARVTEEEFQDGLFRVSVPNYDRRAFREALVNALVHRDFSRNGTVLIQLNNDGLSISNPGGFVEGITLANLLVADPRSRNPHLADVIKRIGLAERTGRGIDRIYEGMLRYGRPAPDYSMSNSSTVSLRMANAVADLDFLKMVVDMESKHPNSLSIDSLIILSRLKDERRLTTSELASYVQKPTPAVRTTLEQLVETGFLERHGTGKGRSYTLSAQLYQRRGHKVEYVRQVGFDQIQQEQMVLQYVKKHGSIKRADVVELCQLTKSQAFKLLKSLAISGKIRLHGVKRGAYYKLNT